MVDLVTNHNVKWLAPSPIWNTAESLNGESVNITINRPAILRFASDTFMEELMAVLQLFPARLQEWIARPETWSDPMPAPATTPLLKINDPIAQSELQLRQKLTKVGRLPKVANQFASFNNGENQSSNDDQPFKLYQAAHQRFYLVATSLVCRRFGLPDREIDAGKQEQVSFVVRRLIHSDLNNDHTVFDQENHQDYAEYAYVMTSRGGAWRNISADRHYGINDLIPEEERLPLFSVNFTVDDGRRRRLLAGLIPVGKRETYIGAGQHIPDSEQANGTAGDGQPEAVSDLRMVLFESKVGSPWRSMLEQAADQKARLFDTAAPDFFEGVEDAPANPNDRINADRKSVVKESREQIQTISWYTLLDFAKFLNQYLPNIWDLVLDTNITSTFSSPTAEQSVFNALLESRIASNIPYSELSLRVQLRKEIEDLTADIKKSMREALKEISDIGLENFENTLEALVEPFEMPPTAQSEWPTFYFPLADPEYPQNILLPGNVASSDLDNAILAIDELSVYIEEALAPAEFIPDPDTLVTAGQILDQREGWFVIRCVYERPNCGPYNPPIVSRPTEPFQMAAFFDPDAPARPIRIPMPVDVSPAGLRKFKKGTAFMISDMLCGHIKRIRKLSLGDLVLSILPWPFHKDLPSPDATGPCGKDQGANFGMLCSLSIPIVTLCALILLIIIVNLFDIFFRWVPYLFTCFKLPGFEAKKQ